ncbi:MAG TPA: glycosyltransferase family 2 protein [Aggregatilineales bacterium]|nr:glycosyltransferase family 2 protein [Aggregatilineales bacterium]
MTDLSIIIVSWNVRDLLRDCLASVEAGAQAGWYTLAAPGVRADQSAPLTVETIVVDNLSSDGTPEMLREAFPWVRLVEPGENTGFTRGNNIGMRASTGRWLLLLNPDTVVLDDALPRMVDYIDAHPAVGALGPQLLNDDGTVQSSRRRFPTFWTAVFESTWLQSAAPRGVLSRYYMTDTQDDEIMPVDWVQGAALLVRRSVLAQVGGFDEHFFMYSEELDWQRRIKAAGWQIVYFPPARIVHYGGKSSEQVAAQRHIYFQTSKVRYFRKHHGRLAGLGVRAVLLANYVAQVAVEGAKFVLGHKRPLRRERVRAYWQVLRSGLRG